MEDKKILRNKLISDRLGLTSDDVKQKSKCIMAKLFSMDDYKNANVIMFYVDMRNEVMTKDAIKSAFEEGKRLVVPKVKKGRHLLAIEIHSLDELVSGTFGVMEPQSEEEITPYDIDMVLVPGVVFDKARNRIGYGAGYYDSFLPSLRSGVKKIAVAFEMQLVDFIPTEPHDIKMDLIITEKEIY